MKLRNKKTGEILESARTSTVIKDKFRIYDEVTDKYYTYNSLAELNDEWEDVPEEPKTHWSISQFGELVDEVDGYMSETIDEMKQIGNYFETKKEAVLAVEKLKAWKRLKDKGFRFDGWNRHPVFPGDFRITASDEYTCDDKDLDLLFGGEE